MNAQIDRRVFQLYLTSAILELELSANADEIAHGRVREKVEALRFEACIILESFDTLPARMRFGVTANRCSAEQPGLVRLVVDPAPHERPLDVCCVRLLRARTGSAYQQHDQSDNRQGFHGAPAKWIVIRPFAL